MADPGTVLNRRFRLDRLIGQGGFARVFLSTDLVLGRQVAVKVLRPDQLADLDTGPFLERFEAEARLIARLEHPNVLGLYDYGQSDGLTYLVMPYVAGGSLHDARRRAGHFTPAEVASYLRQMAAALDYAHANNVVHRDIKPQNMLLRAGSDHLLVADFGIAKVLREDSTQSGTAVIGSAAYMAPEQFQGRVGRATDVYALGCVAHELLTGTPPYPGPAERSMFGHIYGELPRLDANLPDAPAALQPVLDRALAKHPEDRFPTAGALAGAFAAALAAPDVATRPLALPIDAQPTRRLDQPPATTVLPSAAVSSTPARPLAPADAAPTTALLAAPPTSSPPRSLVPWLAASVVTLLVLIGIGIAVYLNRPDADAAGATKPPTYLTTHTKIPLAGHTKPAGFAAWSPDGEILATASEDHTIRVWRKVGGAPIGTIAAHTDAARSLAWSPDGAYLATGARDGFVRIWKLPNTTQPVRTLDYGGNAISALAWYANVLVVSTDRLRFIDTGNNWAELAPASPSEATGVLAWSPDGRYLAAGGRAGSLRLFAADGTLAATLQGHTDTITSISWAPTSDRLAAAGGNLLLWVKPEGSQTGKPATSTPLTGHTGKVRSVAWSPGGEVIVSGADDNTVRVWRPADGKSISLSGHNDPVNQVAWLADGTFVSGDNRSILRWWSADGTPLAWDTSPTGCGVIRLAPAPSAPAVAATHSCGAAEIWR